jgi:Holliday junction resolvase-like predicted endonuclease
MENIHFTHELIKGKIAELVFAQMIRSTDAYTILEFGYEKTLPSLAQMHPKSAATAETMEIIKRAPDFTIINHKNKEVHLIEVKYMRELKPGAILSAARAIEKSWKRAALFLASPSGFYFDTVDTIIKNKGGITPFKHPKITQKTQAAHLALINEFIQAPK